MSLIYIVNKVSSLTSHPALLYSPYAMPRSTLSDTFSALRETSLQSSYDVVVQRVAPLGTLWIFAVVRLDLLPACISLAMTAMFVKQSGLKIMFD